jgi:hypothetical protein
MLRAQLKPQESNMELHHDDDNHARRDDTPEENEHRSDAPAVAWKRELDEYDELLLHRFEDDGGRCPPDQ